MGDGAAEVDVLDAEVLVSILRSGGADNRVVGGVVEVEAGGLGLENTVGGGVWVVTEVGG